MYLSPRKEAEL